MNISSILQLRKSWEVFTRNHPKVVPFLAGLKQSGVQENMEIAVAVRYPDGTEYKTGIRLTRSDMEEIEILKQIRPE